MHAADDLRNLRAVGIDEQRDRLHERWQRVANLDRALHRKVTRARRIEDEADRVRPRLGGGACVTGSRDAADLDAGSHCGLILVTAIWRRTRFFPNTNLPARTWARPYCDRARRAPRPPSAPAAFRRRRRPGCR